MNWCDNWKSSLRGRLKGRPGISPLNMRSRLTSLPSSARNLLDFSGMRRVLAMGLSGLVLLVMLPLHVEAKTKSKSKKPKADKPATEQKQFEIPIPVNHDALGIRIPVFDNAGKLQMYFNSEIAFRADDDHLRMTNLKIETFDDAGKSDMLIDMPKSVLDLNTRVLSSDEPVTIRRIDFEVTGGHMTFDTQTRQGKFNGAVRMLIFNNNSLNDQTGEKTPGEKTK